MNVFLKSIRNLVVSAVCASPIIPISQLLHTESTSAKGAETESQPLSENLSFTLSMRDHCLPEGDFLSFVRTHQTEEMHLQAQSIPHTQRTAYTLRKPDGYSVFLQDASGDICPILMYADSTSNHPAYANHIPAALCQMTPVVQQHLGDAALGSQTYLGNTPLIGAEEVSLDTYGAKTEGGTVATLVLRQKGEGYDSSCIAGIFNTRKDIPSFAETSPSENVTDEHDATTPSLRVVM